MFSGAYGAVVVVTQTRLLLWGEGATRAIGLPRDFTAGRVQAVAVGGATGEDIAVASIGGGVTVSIDAGHHWRVLIRGAAGGVLPPSAVTSLAFLLAPPLRLYAVVGGTLRVFSGQELR